MISSCSSCSGLPSSTQLVQLGCSMKRALWKVVMVSACATPGAITFRPPDQPAMKCGSTRPVAMRRSASTKRRSSRTTVPRRVVPSSTWSASSRAKWFATSTVSSTQGSPTRAASSSPSLGRCSPVATSTVICSGAIPAPSSVRISGGRIVPLGTGRVKSQIRMQARVACAASAASGGQTTGFASAAAMVCAGSASSGIACLAITVISSSSGRSTARCPRP